MFNPVFFYEAGKARSGTVIFPYTDTLKITNISFSTRLHNAVIIWGDGTTTNYTANKNTETTTFVNKTYSAAYTGDVVVKLLGGVKDVYTLRISKAGSVNEAQHSKINISDFGTWISQFTHLYSFYMHNYNYGVTANAPIINGNLFQVPDSVRKIVTGTDMQFDGNWVFDLNGISSTSNLEVINFTANNAVGNTRLTGDLAKLPYTLTYFSLTRVSSVTGISYTPGKVWASSFDTFSFLDKALSSTIINNILIDMNNSITTAIGGKLIRFKGARTSVSDAAVAGLITKGFTVTITA